VGAVQATQPQTSDKPANRRALELVALRGRDVVGVRHVLDGGRATLGTGEDAIVRVAHAGLTGITVAEVQGDAFVLHVPPKARVRRHLASGLGRLGVGPETFPLGTGDRAVLVLDNGVTVRARVVDIEASAGVQPRSSSPLRWIVAVGALYVAILALCASLVPGPPPTALAGPAQRVGQTAQVFATAWSAALRQGGDSTQ
jgi:hypothetical protein